MRICLYPLVVGMAVLTPIRTVKGQPVGPTTGTPGQESSIADQDQHIYTGQEDIDPSSTMLSESSGRLNPAPSITPGYVGRSGRYPNTCLNEPTESLNAESGCISSGQDSQDAIRDLHIPGPVEIESDPHVDTPESDDSKHPMQDILQTSLPHINLPQMIYPPTDVQHPKSAETSDLGTANLKPEWSKREMETRPGPSCSLFPPYDYQGCPPHLYPPPRPWYGPFRQEIRSQMDGVDGFESTTTSIYQNPEANVPYFQAQPSGYEISNRAHDYMREYPSTSGGIGQVIPVTHQLDVPQMAGFGLVPCSTLDGGGMRPPMRQRMEYAENNVYPPHFNGQSEIRPVAECYNVPQKNPCRVQNPRINTNSAQQHRPRRSSALYGGPREKKKKKKNSTSPTYDYGPHGHESSSSDSDSSREGSDGGKSNRGGSSFSRGDGTGVGIVAGFITGDAVESEESGKCGGCECNLDMIQCCCNDQSCNPVSTCVTSMCSDASGCLDQTPDAIGKCVGCLFTDMENNICCGVGKCLCTCFCNETFCDGLWSAVTNGGN
jgi:hypothetical protein